MTTPPADEAPPHVDDAMLADILSFTSVEFVVESIDEFLAGAGATLDDIAQGLERADRRSVERLAHRLRGSCGITGALRLAEICAGIEDGAAESPPPLLAGGLEEARAELDVVRELLLAKRRRLLSGEAGGAG